MSVTTATSCIKYVSYVRVSTTKQGVSGLGLEAQQDTIRQYLNQQGAAAEDHLCEFIEVESGKNNKRPQLAAALYHCDITGSVLLVAKLDRLSRDLHFITSLQKAGVSFIVCDFPSANNFTLHIFAALAQYEAELISQRTKAALTALRDRGVRLGNPGNLSPDSRAAGRAAGVTARSHKATAHAGKLAPLVTGYRSSGMTLRQIADRLNADRVQTGSGREGNWTATTVSRVLAGGAF